MLTHFLHGVKYVKYLFLPQTFQEIVNMVLFVLILKKYHFFEISTLFTNFLHNVKNVKNPKYVAKLILIETGTNY